MPPTVSVTVIVVELLSATVAEEISTPEVKVMFGGAEVLNSKPVGALSTKVNPEPELKSILFLSAMAMGPSVVQAGEIALPALSAERLLPPEAGVIVTDANAQVPKSDPQPIASLSSAQIVRADRRMARSATALEHKLLTKTARTLRVYLQMTPSKS